MIVEVFVCLVGKVNFFNDRPIDVLTMLHLGSMDLKEPTKQRILVQKPAAFFQVIKDTTIKSIITANVIHFYVDETLFQAAKYQSFRDL